MIWTITKRELLSNIIKFRFLISLILCLILITASTFVLTMDYTIRLKEYKEESAARVEYLKTVKVHSQIKSGVGKPPSPLGFLCVGSEREFGDTVQDVSYREVPREAIGEGGGNPLAGIFSSLDIAVFVQVILGLLAFLLAYDAISGERETGTLAVMLSNPVPRHHSPTMIYRSAVEAVAGAGISHYESFMKQVHRYRLVLQDRLISHHPADIHKQYPGGEVTRLFSNLDFTEADVPKFQDEPILLEESIRNPLWDMAILLIYNIVLFMAAYISFLKRDVR